MNLPLQRGPVDIGDGWADQLAHTKAELAAARADCCSLQTYVDGLREAVCLAHDVLNPDAPLPSPGEAVKALEVLHAALARPVP